MALISTGIIITICVLVLTAILLILLYCFCRSKNKIHDHTCVALLYPDEEKELGYHKPAQQNGKATKVYISGYREEKAQTESKLGGKNISKERHELETAEVSKKRGSKKGRHSYAKELNDLKKASEMDLNDKRGSKEKNDYDKAPKRDSKDASKNGFKVKRDLNGKNDSSVPQKDDAKKSELKEKRGSKKAKKESIKVQKRDSKKEKKQTEKNSEIKNGDKLETKKKRNSKKELKPYDVQVELRSEAKLENTPLPEFLRQSSGQYPDKCPLSVDENSLKKSLEKSHSERLDDETRPSGDKGNPHYLRPNSLEEQTLSAKERREKYARSDSVFGYSMDKTDGGTLYRRPRSLDILDSRHTNEEYYVKPRGESMRESRRSSSYYVTPRILEREERERGSHYVRPRSLGDDRRQSESQRESHYVHPRSFEENERAEKIRRETDILSSYYMSPRSLNEIEKNKRDSYYVTPRTLEAEERAKRDRGYYHTLPSSFGGERGLPSSNYMSPKSPELEGKDRDLDSLYVHPPTLERNARGWSEREAHYISPRSFDNDDGRRDRDSYYVHPRTLEKDSRETREREEHYLNPRSFDNERGDRDSHYVHPRTLERDALDREERVDRDPRTIERDSRNDRRGDRRYSSTLNMRPRHSMSYTEDKRRRPRSAERSERHERNLRESQRSSYYMSPRQLEMESNQSKDRQDRDRYQSTERRESKGRNDENRRSEQSGERERRERSNEREKKNEQTWMRREERGGDRRSEERYKTEKRDRSRERNLRESKGERERSSDRHSREERDKRNERDKRDGRDGRKRSTERENREEREMRQEKDKRDGRDGRDGRERSTERESKEERERRQEREMRDERERRDGRERSSDRENRNRTNRNDGREKGTDKEGNERKDGRKKSLERDGRERRDETGGMGKRNERESRRDSRGGRVERGKQEKHRTRKTSEEKSDYLSRSTKRPLPQDKPPRSRARSHSLEYLPSSLKRKKTQFHVIQRTKSWASRPTLRQRAESPPIPPQTIQLEFHPLSGDVTPLDTKSEASTEPQSISTVENVQLESSPVLDFEKPPKRFNDEDGKSWLGLQRDSRKSTTPQNGAFNFQSDYVTGKDKQVNFQNDSKRSFEMLNNTVKKREKKDSTNFENDSRRSSAATLTNSLMNEERKEVSNLSDSQRSTPTLTNRLKDEDTQSWHTAQSDSRRSSTTVANSVVNGYSDREHVSERERRDNLPQLENDGDKTIVSGSLLIEYGTNKQSKPRNKPRPKSAEFFVKPQEAQIDLFSNSSYDSQSSTDDYRVYQNQIRKLNGRARSTGPKLSDKEDFTNPLEKRVRSEHIINLKSANSQTVRRVSRSSLSSDEVDWHLYTVDGRKILRSEATIEYKQQPTTKAEVRRGDSLDGQVYALYGKTLETERDIVTTGESRNTTGESRNATKTNVTPYSKESRIDTNQNVKLHETRASIVTQAPTDVNTGVTKTFIIDESDTDSVTQASKLLRDKTDNNVVTQAPTASRNESRSKGSVRASLESHLRSSDIAQSRNITSVKPRRSSSQPVIFNFE